MILMIHLNLEWLKLESSDCLRR